VSRLRWNGGKPMIRAAQAAELGAIFRLINEAAEAYRGVIPADCFTEPYMGREELEEEIAHGVVFYVLEEDGELLGVMGSQDVSDVMLLRHAYVQPGHQRRGIGGALLSFLRAKTSSPMLVGTWADAVWAIRFYEKHGFQPVAPAEKDRLLTTYWQIPERQAEVSIVLADSAWLQQRGSITE
jgi:N-acetylglutamate synthase-like GNAT family acetyltransferase